MGTTRVDIVADETLASFKDDIEDEEDDDEREKIATDFAWVSLRCNGDGLGATSEDFLGSSRTQIQSVNWQVISIAPQHSTRQQNQICTDPCLSYDLLFSLIFAPSFVSALIPLSLSLLFWRTRLRHTYVQGCFLYTSTLRTRYYLRFLDDDRTCRYNIKDRNRNNQTWHKGRWDGVGLLSRRRERVTHLGLTATSNRGKYCMRETRATIICERNEKNELSPVHKTRRGRRKRKKTRRAHLRLIVEAA